MIAYWTILKNYWASLNDRERWVTAGGVLCVCLYLYYLLLYAPLASHLQQARQRYQEQQDTLLWMRQQAPLLRKNTTKIPDSLTSGQLLTQLSSQLRQISLQNFPAQLQQTTSGDIAITFEKIPMQIFLDWLWRMNQRYAISIKQCVFDSTEVAGLVKVQAVLAVR